MDFDVHCHHVCHKTGLMNPVDNCVQNTRRTLRKSTEKQRETQVGASPILKAASKKLPVQQTQKRTRTTSELSEGTDKEEGEPSAKKMSGPKNADDEMDFRAIICQIKKGLDTVTKEMCRKKDLTEMVGRIEENSRDIKKLFSLYEEQRRNFKDDVLKIVRNKGSDMSETSTSAVGLSLSNRECYLKCQRSIRIWPVRDSPEGLKMNCRSLLEDVLAIPREAVGSLQIECVRRIAQPRRSRVHEEVLVRFATSQQRDLVQSYANNLAQHNGKAGIYQVSNAHT